MDKIDKIDKIIKVIKEASEKKYTGQIRLNFHRGDLSHAIELKYATVMGDDGDRLTQII